MRLFQQLSVFPPAPNTVKLGLKSLFVKSHKNEVKGFRSCNKSKRISNDSLISYIEWFMAGTPGGMTLLVGLLVKY